MTLRDKMIETIHRAVEAYEPPMSASPAADDVIALLAREGEEK